MTPDTPTPDDIATQECAHELPPIDRLAGVDNVDELTETQWRALVVRSLQSGEARMDGMDSSIAENTRIAGGIASDTAAIREIVLMGRSFFSGLNKFAHGCARVWRVLKPILQAATVIAGTIVAIKAALSGGHSPASGGPK
jgi:hypothetical protein